MIDLHTIQDQGLRISDHDLKDSEQRERAQELNGGFHKSCDQAEGSLLPCRYVRRQKMKRSLSRGLFGDEALFAHDMHTCSW